MEVNRVGSRPVSFGMFGADAKGTYNLAMELVGKPDLEQKFMENLFKPLMNTKFYDVFIEGNTVGITNKEGKGLMSIVQPGSLYDRTLGVVYDYTMYCRNGLRRNSYVIPTENFKNDGYLLHHIEVAKNIVFDREAMAAKNATDSYAKIAEETVDQKYDRFAQLFNVSG